MKCQQEGCEAEATVEVFWPGQTTLQCARHAQSIVGLGSTMGFRVETRPIPEAEPIPGEEKEAPQSSG